MRRGIRVAGVSTLKTLAMATQVSKTMSKQVVSTAIKLLRGFFKGVTDQEESVEEESVEDILNRVKNNLHAIVKTESGQRLLKDVGKLGNKVETFEVLEVIIKELFQLAKEVTDMVMNWLSSNRAQVTLAIFVLLIAALTYLAPETMVAVWVNTVIHNLGVSLANIFHRLKDFTMAVAEFFQRSGLELSVQLLPTFNLRVPLGKLATATNMAPSE